MDYPCRYCVAPKRHVGCHSTCPEYLAVKEANRPIVEEINQKKLAERDANSYVCESIQKVKKRLNSTRRR